MVCIVYVLHHCIMQVGYGRDNILGKDDSCDSTSAIFIPLFLYVKV